MTVEARFSKRALPGGDDSAESGGSRRRLRLPLVLLIALAALAGWPSWRRAPVCPPVVPGRSAAAGELPPHPVLRIEDLALTDSDGPWLRIEGLNVEFDTIDSDTMRFRLRRAVVGRAEVHRLPPKNENRARAVSHPGESFGSGREGGWFLEAVDLAIGEVVLHPPATGMDAVRRLRADGNGYWRHDRSGALNLRITASEPYEASADLVLSSEESGALLRYNAALKIDADELRVRGVFEPERSRMETVLTGRAGRLALRGSGVLDGSGGAPAVTGSLHARLVGSTPQAGILDAWLPEGSAVLRLTATREGRRQDLRGTLIAHAAAVAGSRADAVSLDIGLSDIWGARPWARLDLDLRDARYEDRLIEAATVGVRVSTDEGSLPAVALPDGMKGWTAGLQAVRLLADGLRARKFRLDFGGECRAVMADMPLRLSLAGALRGVPDAGGEHDLTVERLEGGMGSIDFRLIERLAVRRTPDDLVLAPFRAAIGPALATGGGRLRADAIEARLHWRDAPLELIPFIARKGIGANTGGRLHVFGSRGDPEIRLEMNATDIAVAGARPPPGLLDNVVAIVTNAPDGLAVRMHGRGPEGQTRIALQTLLPWKPDLAGAPFFAPVPHPRLWGGLTAAIPVETLADFFLADDTRRFGGDLQGSLHWDGTPESPDLTGMLMLRGGHYRDLPLGVALRRVEIVIRGDREGVRIETAEARDRGDGKLSLEGRLDFWPWGRWRHDFNLTASNLRIVERDDVTAFVGGSLALTGEAAASRLSGRLRLQPVEVRLPERLPAPIPALPLARSDGVAVDGLRERPALFPRLALDVSIEAPNRVFVRNRAVDSEWRGRLDITGYLEQPVVRGDFEAMHGRFMVLGRRFDLRHGSILFPGYPVVPYFDALAEAAAGGIVARLRLSGTPHDAQWELSSVPELPEDEILAHVFFRRAGGALTPGQALRLAQAAEALAGGGRLTDVLEHGRRALRVDRFDLVEGSGADESARVSVGKHIGERGYLDLEKNIVHAEGGRVVLSADLTSSVSLETTVETDGERGIGIRWRHDY